jgi:hypothetical protein
MNLQKVIHWAGVVCGILAGIAAIVAAIVLEQVAYAAWGLVFIAGSIIATVSGAKARPDGSLNPKKPRIGAVFKQIPTGAWVAIALMFAGAVVVSFIFPPWA